MAQYKFKLNGKSYTCEVEEKDDNKLSVTLNGKTYDVDVEREKSKLPTPAVNPVVAPAAPAAAPVAAPRPTVAAGQGAIQSPLPGVVLDVKVKEGDQVQVGQVVMVLEAMKMENNIEATAAGTVASIAKQKGDSVMEGDVLITLK